MKRSIDGTLPMRQPPATVRLIHTMFATPNVSGGADRLAPDNFSAQLKIH